MMILIKYIFTLTLFVHTCYNMNNRLLSEYPTNFGDKNNYCNFTKADTILPAPTCPSCPFCQGKHSQC